VANKNYGLAKALPLTLSWYIENMGKKAIEKEYRS
jgi:hypothetical protein